jgi:uncharacterized protein
MLRGLIIKGISTILIVIGFQCVYAHSNFARKSGDCFEKNLTIKRKVFPANLGVVTDFEHIFTPKQIQKITRRIQEIKSSTGTEIAVVSLDSTYCNTKNFDGYVLQLANFWGVGDAKLDNGILIGVSKQFRKIRICNGLGIETILSNDQTKEIIDNSLIPKFKKNKYFRGIMNGLDSLETHLLTHQIVVV